MSRAEGIQQLLAQYEAETERLRAAQPEKKPCELCHVYARGVDAFRGIVDFECDSMLDCARQVCRRLAQYKAKLDMVRKWFEFDVRYSNAEFAGAQSHAIAAFANENSALAVTLQERQTAIERLRVRVECARQAAEHEQQAHLRHAQLRTARILQLRNSLLNRKQVSEADSAFSDADEQSDEEYEEQQNEVEDWREDELRDLCDYMVSTELQETAQSDEANLAKSTSCCHIPPCSAPGSDNTDACSARTAEDAGSASQQAAKLNMPLEDMQLTFSDY